MKIVFFIIFSCLVVQELHSQDIPVTHQRYILFPHPLHNKWTTSVGLTATTMPYEITEELHYRIPAIDLHLLRKWSDHIYLDGRINSQVVQNLITAGPHWATSLSDRVSIGVGDDIGMWVGFLNVEGFKTKGHGWQNYPSVSLGYRFNKQILLTLKADALMTFGVKTYAGKIPVATNYSLFSGSSYTVALEQPFYGNKSLTLGFRAIYTSFFWQTWTAFSNYNRSFFYPQLIVGLIL